MAEGRNISLFWQPEMGGHWGMLELQGELATTASTLDNLRLGVLSMEGHTAVVTIGHHKLEGKVVELAKPLLITEGTVATASDNSGAEQLRVLGVVKRKLVFRHRPKMQVTTETLDIKKPVTATTTPHLLPDAQSPSPTTKKQKTADGAET